MRALLLAWLAVGAALVAGCADAPDPRADLVPYPRVGDAAVYEATGAYVELSRWENGHMLVGAQRVAFTVRDADAMLDGARQAHDAYRVDVTVGGARKAEHYISQQQHARIQSLYPLSQDQSVLAFDERSFPWLFGASALFGEALSLGTVVPLRMEDNLGGGGDALASLAWRVTGEDEAGWTLALEGSSSIEGELVLARGDAWPTRARLTVKDDGLAPHVRIDAAYPATMEARRVELTRGDVPLSPRNSGASFVADDAVARAAWSGEAPPDGDATYAPYLLADAMRDAKLLDRGLAAWLAAADDPRLYRATHKVLPVANETGALPETSAPYWLLQWMEKGDTYYEVQVERPGLDRLGVGVPRVVKSGPTEGPGDESHGWFAKDALPADLVTLAEGVRIVKTTFGAQGVQIFLRSFADPPGYSYFLDGGWDGPNGERGRYTVVYNPQTGFIEEATGPVAVLVAG